MTDWINTLDRRLNLARPARYDADDKTWVHDVADTVELNDIEMQEAKRNYVRSRAVQLEANATKSANKSMRKWLVEGAHPLPGMIDHLPISFKMTVTEGGKEKQKTMRVRFADATVADLEAWARTLTLEAQRTYEAQMETVQAIHAAIGEMRAHRMRRAGEWTALPDEKSA